MTHVANLNGGPRVPYVISQGAELAGERLARSKSSPEARFTASAMGQVRVGLPRR
jgi:hypothetical protein